MPHWYENTHADYVIAAYAIAAFALIGLAALSWRAYRDRVQEWHKISEQVDLQ